jgi:hypothetical protein
MLSCTSGGRAAGMDTPREGQKVSYHLVANRKMQDTLLPEKARSKWWFRE